ncbi:hypothetical protein D3C81_1529300 [compost metagenome]
MKIRFDSGVHDRMLQVRFGGNCINLIELHSNQSVVYLVNVDMAVVRDGLILLLNSFNSAGKLDQYRYDRFMELHKPFIKRFKSWATLEQFAKGGDDW